MKKSYITLLFLICTTLFTNCKSDNISVATKPAAPAGSATLKAPAKPIKAAKLNLTYSSDIGRKGYMGLRRRFKPATIAPGYAITRINDVVGVARLSNNTTEVKADLIIEGYALDTQNKKAASDVLIRINEDKFYKSISGFSTPSLANENPNYAKSGFKVKIPKSDLKAGSNTIRIDIISSDKKNIWLPGKTWTITNN